MSFDLPASLEHDLELYAQAEHISPTEAAVKLIQDALKAKSRGAAKKQSQSIDWNKFQQLVPGFDLFQQLPEGIVDDLARSSRRLRAEKLTPRA